MATEIAAPIKAPTVNYSDDWQKVEDDYIETVRAALKGANHGKLIGEIVRWQRADGYAVYMVATEHPLRLVHLDLGDGYRIEAALMRGLTLTEVGRMVESERAWRELASGPNETFYTKDRVGQIVHYSNGFGQYVRCEVVAAEEHDNTTSRDRKTIGGVALKPIALVGEIRHQDENGRWTQGWSQSDLPRRMPNGTVMNGYHVKQVLEGELMQPHAGSIYEYEGFHDRAGIDPRELEPISLVPPDMSESEERLAALVRELEEISTLVDGADKRTESDVIGALVAIHKVAGEAVRDAL